MPTRAQPSLNLVQLSQQLYIERSWSSSYANGFRMVSLLRSCEENAQPCCSCFAPSSRPLWYRPPLPGNRRDDRRRRTSTGVRPPAEGRSSPPRSRRGRREAWGEDSIFTLFWLLLLGAGGSQRTRTMMGSVKVTTTTTTTTTTPTPTQTNQQTNQPSIEPTNQSANEPTNQPTTNNQ